MDASDTSPQGTETDNATMAAENNSLVDEIMSGPPPYSFARMVELYSMPIICSFGLIGNTMATIIFLQKPMRNKSCSLYLVARSISDNVFLFALAVMWVGRTFNLEVNSTNGICHILVFLTYICACVSVWLVVFVTVENYIRICHPFIVKRLCTPKTAKVLIIVLCVGALATYHFPIWISNSDCTTNPNYIGVTQAFVYIDSALTLALPSVMMFILIVIILYNLLQSYNRRERMKQNNCVSVTRKNPMAKVTKMLLAVSIIFITLNLPSHVIRIRFLINSFTGGEIREPPDIEAAIQSVTLLVYYLSLAINVVIYYIFGENFRKVFQAKFCGKVAPSSKGRRNESIPLTSRTRKVSLTMALDEEGTSQPFPSTSVSDKETMTGNV